MTSQATYLTSGQVAEILGVNRATVRRWVNTGRIPAIKLPSGVARFRPEDIEAITATGLPAETAATA